MFGLGQKPERFLWKRHRKYTYKAGTNWTALRKEVRKPQNFAKKAKKVEKGVDFRLEVC